MLRRNFIKLGTLALFGKKTKAEQPNVPLFIPTYKWLHEREPAICFCVCELSAGTYGSGYALEYDRENWLCRVSRYNHNGKYTHSAALFIFRDDKWTPIDYMNYFDHNFVSVVEWPNWVRKF